MKIKSSIRLLACVALVLCACDNKVIVDSEIGETTIMRLHEDKLSVIPFESVDVLKSFSGDTQILEFETARKLAMVELMATGMDADMGWEGCKIEPIPVVIYGFDNKPKYYDFIVLDAEEQAVGNILLFVA